MTSELVNKTANEGTMVPAPVRRVRIGRLFRSPFKKIRTGPSADQIVLIPQDLRTADPSFTTEVYHGHFGLAGAVAMTDGDSPFRIDPPNNEWLRELHGFGWMRHFNASNSEQAIAQAKFLVQDWVKLHSRQRGIAWEPNIVARRLISWTCHIAPLLEDNDPSFYALVMKQLTQQIRYLSTNFPTISDGLPRLTALIALNLAGICIGRQSYLLDQYLGTLCDELDRQILGDGGHISRHPAMTVDLMFDLLPLKQCFISQGKKPPGRITYATKRIFPMLRFVRLGDGYLAHFNGMGATLPDMLATILSYDDYTVSLQGHAPLTGYSRIEQKKTIVVADTGAPTDVSFSELAHAGCLSFEMSTGIYPLIVNCGAPGPANQEWALTARTTPYHSTLSINKSSSVRLLKKSFLNKHSSSSLLRGPDNVTGEVSEENGQVILNASHDGYVSRYNTIYSRKLILKHEGTVLEGHEHLWPQDDTPSKQRRFPFSIHFHVHPDVQVSFSEDRQSVNMTLPNGEVWTFSAGNLMPALEESLFLADYRGLQRSLQIVLRGICNAKTKFTWTIKKTKEEDEDNAPPPLPLNKVPARMAKVKQKLIFSDPDQSEDDFDT